MILKTNVFVLVPVTPITERGENMQKSLYHVRNLKEMEGGSRMMRDSCCCCCPDWQPIYNWADW